MRRRHFLATAVASSALPCAFAQERRDERPAVNRPDRFTRIAPGLAPFARASEALTAALMEIGKPGGMMDARDDLARGPVDLIVDPALSTNNPNSAVHTAGITFLGQFIDHDLTFDTGSVLGRSTDPVAIENERTPGFDLDSVYGEGPVRSRELYESVRGSRAPTLRIESGGLFEDLPRDAQGKAILADRRNDENLILAGLHAAFLKFHNAAVAYVAARDRRASDEQVFGEARRLTTWHYQWIVLHEFLPLVVGQALVDDVLTNGTKLFDSRVPTMPVEFSVAAYRMGHSMIRPSYRANLAGNADGSAFFGLIFDPAGEGQADPVDLRGGKRARRRFIGWQTFFDFGDGNVRPNKALDTKLSTPLFNLPASAIPAPGGPTSLAQRNLLRHVTFALPSGQAIAARLAAPVLGSGDFADLAGLPVDLRASTPLWFYILREAEIIEKGTRLGPVGGRIVAETFVRLMQLGRGTILDVPRWRPSLPSRTSGEFRMVDFLTFAGVDPAARGQ